MSPVGGGLSFIDSIRTNRRILGAPSYDVAVENVASISGQHEGVLEDMRGGSESSLLPRGVARGFWDGDGFHCRDDVYPTFFLLPWWTRIVVRTRFRFVRPQPNVQCTVARTLGGQEL